MSKYLKLIGIALLLSSTNLWISHSFANDHDSFMIEGYKHETSMNLSKLSDSRLQLKRDFLADEKENSSYQINQWTLMLASYWLDFRLGDDMVYNLTLSNSEFDPSRISTQANFGVSILTLVQSNKALINIVDHIESLYYGKFCDLINTDLENIDFSSSIESDSDELIFRHVEAKVLESLAKISQKDLKILLRTIYEEVQKNSNEIPEFPAIESTLPHLNPDLGYRDMLLIQLSSDF